MKQNKTNAMRELDAKGIAYVPHWYSHDKNDSVDGVSVANRLGLPVEKVFKTLVTIANTKDHYVCMIPVDKELDLKQCARACRVKHLEMIPMKDLLKVTGYIRGGCSPIGMKKAFPTYIDESAFAQDTIYFSAGKIGTQIECDPVLLEKEFGFHKAKLSK